MNTTKTSVPFSIAHRVWDWKRDLPGPLGWKKNGLFVLKDDLFAEEQAPTDNRAACGAFGVMGARRFSQFVVWTHHPDRMRQWLEWAIRESREEGRYTAPAVAEHGALGFIAMGMQSIGDKLYQASNRCAGLFYPLPNVRLAAVVRTQDEANARIPELMLCLHEQCVVICDPVKGMIDLRTWLHLKTCSVYLEDDPSERERTNCDCRQVIEQLVREGKMCSVGWIVAGGGYGPKAQLCPIDALVSLVRQGKQASVPVHISRLGARPKNGRLLDWRPAKLPGFDPHFAHKDECRLHAPKGDDVNEWPGVLRVQDRPRWATLRSTLGDK